VSGSAINEAAKTNIRLYDIKTKQQSLFIAARTWKQLKDVLSQTGPPDYIIVW